ncbi:MAG: hypothetical protein ACE5D8_09325 [Fidelibacterota bacterium]
MNKYWLLLIMFTVLKAQSTPTPADYWESLSEPEKIAFVNGVYAAISSAKAHHNTEVKKQYIHQKDWIPPYYIERYYDILDDYISKKAGYQLETIARTVDAIYSNYENRKIPLMDAIRVASLSQDGKRQKANLVLYRSQKSHP